MSAGALLIGIVMFSHGLDIISKAFYFSMYFIRVIFIIELYGSKGPLAHYDDLPLCACKSFRPYAANKGSLYVLP